MHLWQYEGAVPRLLQDLLDTSPEKISGVKCHLTGWLDKWKVLSSILKELLGGGTYIENRTEFTEVADVTDTANPKALQIGFICWLGLRNGWPKRCSRSRLEA